MTKNCLKCVYPKDQPKDQPKGERACKNCGRPENVSKAEWQGRTTAQEEPYTVTLEDLIGPTDVLASLPPEPKPEPPLYVESVTKAVAAVEKAYGDPPMGAGGATPPAGDVCSAGSPALTSSVSTAESATLPAHSKLGGSGAKRWMNCTASTALLAQLKPRDEEDPDFTREGTQAHALAAICLETGDDAWEHLHEYDLLKAEHLDPINVYIEHVRALPGRKRYEVKHHRPELHPDMFGTIDADVLNIGPERSRLNIVDFKFGAGVYVPADDPQLKYYAVMVIMEDEGFWSPNDEVRLTVVQPRLDWVDEAIRHHDTTVGDLLRWLHGELLPAMHVEAKDMVYSLGEWCRFCKAKLMCPAMEQSFRAFSGVPVESLAERSDEDLGRLFEQTATVAMLLKAIKDEVLKRQLEGRKVPGSKLVAGKADRVFKEQIPHGDGVLTLREALEAKFGKLAWRPAALISPAMAEKLPDSKDFVAEWAYKPEVNPTVALADDKRKEVAAPTIEQKYGDLSKWRVDNVQSVV